MLRPYKPIGDEIFTLHKMIKHLVCNVWCQADKTSCLDKIVSGKKKRYKFKLREIVARYKDLNSEVERIYNKFSTELTLEEKTLIKKAFNINNRIEDLCDGKIEPLRKNQLPKVVEEDIYPLFKILYKTIFDKKLVNGDKLTYYQKLNKENAFRYCPCCGYMAFDSYQSGSRESYDHYLPISEYPFAGINFKNLVPLCHKCNSSEKHDSDTLLNGRKAFYPFRQKPIEITIRFTLTREFKETLAKIITKNEKHELLHSFLDISLSSLEQEQVETWNSLFNIKKRFLDRTVGFSLEILEDIRGTYVDEKGVKTYLQVIDFKIQSCKRRKFSDENYLKVPFLEAVRNWSSLIDYWSKKVGKPSDYKKWSSDN